MKEGRLKMKFNTDSSFVGLETLKSAHSRQIDLFETWAAHREWDTFHYSHYDWWTFPIDRPSAYGLKWVVYEGEIAQLKADDIFMQKYTRGLTLLAASWGWDLPAANFIAKPYPAQSWHNWPIRLYKAALSAQLFGQMDSFNSYAKYAHHLLTQGESFQYNNRDLSLLFK